MYYDIYRNGSGYVDSTAYKAIKNYLKSEENEMEVYNGDIFEVELNNGAIRECVIISAHENYSTVLMLTNNDSLPYSINCQGMKYTDPGMIQYVFNDKLKNLIRSMKQDELDDLMQEVIDGLGYEAPVKEVVKEQVPIAAPEISISEELTKLQAERDIFKGLYEDLLHKVMVK